ncbi:MAG TPA: linear amide C-N hydrolase [Pseudolabrys sp.]|nr:linear amide C-N hydrolase [Pseudolabrys sp.]
MQWRSGVFGGAAALALIAFGPSLADACSRALWSDNGQAVVTGRNMDWPEDMKTDLWAFPRGIARKGGSGDANELAWTSKYGSVAAAVYNMATGDGINEKGLVANLLWLSESDYGKRDPGKPGLALSLWAQYNLDNFATVDEAVADIAKGGYQLVTAAMPGHETATVHLSLSDASGDSAIVEIVDGGQVRIHHDRRYLVMTNSPPFAEQLANLEKYHVFGGEQPLPGTSEASDRFVRAAYYIQNQTKPSDLRQTVARMLSVMRNVAQPFVQPDPKRPEASHTIWRAVADSTNRIYFYESTLSPNIVWVTLDGLDFAAGQPVRKLDLVNSGDLVGNVTDQFKPAEPFVFKTAGP